MKLRLKYRGRVNKPSMARRRRSFRRSGRTVYRLARRGYRSGRRRGLFKGGRGGNITGQVWNGLKDGIAYGTVAGRFAPQLAPLAELYGNWKGGGLVGVLANQLFVNGFLGRPSALAGLGLNLGGLLPGLGGGGQQAMGGAV